MASPLSSCLRIGTKVCPQKCVGMIRNRNHVLPAMTAGVNMKLMSQTESCEFLVESLVRLRETISILVSDIEVDLYPGFLDRGEILFDHKNRIRRAEILFIRRIAENLSDQLRQELRPSISTCWSRHFRNKRGAMGGYRRKHLGVFERKIQCAPSAHRNALNRTSCGCADRSIGFL